MACSAHACSSRGTFPPPFLSSSHGTTNPKGLAAPPPGPGLWISCASLTLSIGCLVKVVRPARRGSLAWRYPPMVFALGSAPTRYLHCGMIYELSGRRHSKSSPKQLGGMAPTKGDGCPEDRLRLERAGILALGEYVPGAVVIAGSRSIRSRGLLKHWTGENIGFRRGSANSSHPGRSPNRWRNCCPRHTNC